MRWTRCSASSLPGQSAETRPKSKHSVASEGGTLMALSKQVRTPWVVDVRVTRGKWRFGFMRRCVMATCCGGITMRFVKDFYKTGSIRTGQVAQHADPRGRAGGGGEGSCADHHQAGPLPELARRTSATMTACRPDEVLGRHMRGLVNLEEDVDDILEAARHDRGDGRRIRAPLVHCRIQRRHAPPGVN